VRFPLRLVKGAYWDSEIKLAQQRGLQGYPVFTRKEATDVAYLACARFLLGPACAGRLLPQFASHNAQTLACVLQMAAEQGRTDFEVQRLHGMGETLFDCLPEGLRRRIYAPVGAHRELLPYLVRRLLEDGANASFVHRLGDAQVPLEQLVMHPLEQLRSHASLSNPLLPPPARLFAPRRNSAGFNLHVGQAGEAFLGELKEQLQRSWRATPLLEGEELQGPVEPLYGPWQRDRCLGGGVRASQSQARSALARLSAAAPAWRQTSVEQRAQVLERLADLLEAQRAELVALCCLEAGKTIQDGLDEVREAVDFCRYYALQARELMQRRLLPGPVGELNEHYYEGRGLVVCISPWNFPLAIFLGQVCAALVTGNVVLAKPAEQTPLIATRAVQLLFEAGLPPTALALLPGDGALLGEVFCADPRVVAVCFTGSSAVARTINQRLAQREGALAALIAETGGQNALIADSTALPEQLVRDVIASAFTSAGQRCSALRLLCVPQPLAERVIELLRGAMAELRVGPPARLDSDLGPLIDGAALQALRDYLQQVQGRVLSAGVLPEGLDGFYLAPQLVEIERVSALGEEHFGPVLHLLRYPVDGQDALIDSINALGYGLTLGVHSRNQGTIAHIEARVQIGNLYVNRNQIGAVVGVQPFGGLGLSGTGPKAGGPDYLRRLCVERCSTRNTAAVGGNAALFDLRGDD
jgi:RHH-type proline utilization regulon transcriptional repressor/proline dehydrogenase/delta 1-pyrroline-5-carboxylate dehydrogenase